MKKKIILSLAITGMAAIGVVFWAFAQSLEWSAIATVMAVGVLLSLLFCLRITLAPIKWLILPTSYVPYCLASGGLLLLAILKCTAGLPDALWLRLFAVSSLMLWLGSLAAEGSKLRVGLAIATLGFCSFLFLPGPWLHTAMAHVFGAAACREYTVAQIAGGEVPLIQPNGKPNAYYCIDAKGLGLYRVFSGGGFTSEGTRLTPVDPKTAPLIRAQCVARSHNQQVLAGDGPFSGKTASLVFSLEETPLVFTDATGTTVLSNPPLTNCRPFTKEDADKRVRQEAADAVARQTMDRKPVDASLSSQQTAASAEAREQSDRDRAQAQNEADAVEERQREAVVTRARQVRFLYDASRLPEPGDVAVLALKTTSTGREFDGQLACDLAADCMAEKSRVSGFTLKPNAVKPAVLAWLDARAEPETARDRVALPELIALAESWPAVVTTHGSVSAGEQQLRLRLRRPDGQIVADATVAVVAGGLNGRTAREALAEKSRNWYSTMLKQQLAHCSAKGGSESGGTTGRDVR